MPAEKTTITVQLDVEYDPKHARVSDISTGLHHQLTGAQEEKPYGSPAGEPSWWARAVRVVDSAAGPAGFDKLATCLNNIGEAADRYDAGQISLGALMDTIREQVGDACE